MSGPRTNRFTEELRDAPGEVRLRLPSSFNALMAPRDQERFLVDPSYVDADGERVDDFPLRVKYGVRYTSIQKMPRYEDCVAVTRAYVRACIPAFVRSEQAYWNVTGRPGGKWAVLRVNMNWQINYDVFTDWQGGYVYRVFLWREYLDSLFGGQVDRHYEPRPAVPFSIYDRQEPEEPLRLTLSTGHTLACDWLKSGLVAGGVDQIILRVFSRDDALALLDDPQMIRAARIFALNLARMGKTPFGRYHCFDLADRLVEDGTP